MIPKTEYKIIYNIIVLKQLKLDLLDKGTLCVSDPYMTACSSYNSLQDLCLSLQEAQLE